MALGLHPWFEGDMYEVVIGGGGTGDNQVSVLRKKVGVDEVQRVDTPSITDCDYFRRFWITYEKGNIKGTNGFCLYM